MATLHFAVLKSRQKVKQTFVVYLALTHQRKVRYIPTEYEIDDLFQFDNGKIVCRKDAKIMNQRLNYVLSLYQEKLDSIEDISIYNCSQIKELLEGKHKMEQNARLIDCMDSHIKDLRKEGRNNYADMNLRTLGKVKSILGDITLKSISPMTIDKFRNRLTGSNATIQMRLSHLKACINDAIRGGLVKYDIHPFAYTKMPKSPAKQLDLTIEEFVKIKNFETSLKKLSLAKDLYLLSFYLGGINLIDMMDADYSDTILSYERTKTTNKKQGEKVVTFSIPEPARVIIGKYIKRNGKLDFGYKYTYSNFQKYLNKCLKDVSPR